LFPRRKALLHARIVATGNRELIDSGRIVMLDLRFWSLESEYLSESEPDFSVPVNIPSNWSSQFYLDALSHSVKLHGIISINTAQAVVGLCNTVNSVHALYQLISLPPKRSLVFNKTSNIYTSKIFVGIRIDPYVLVGRLVLYCS
jgi:hypothetical protein